MADQNEENSKQIEGIESLNEINNKLQEAQPENIKTLKITSCKFEFPDAGTPGLFEDCSKSLEFLLIDNNQIARLNGGTFYRLKNLRYLQLTANSIEAIQEGAFSDLPSLYSLDISHNKLRTLTDRIFDGLDNLGCLLVRNNEISAIQSEAFKDLRGLFNLELSNNKIEELGESVFGDLDNLGHLVLKNNRIQGLPPRIFANLKKLFLLDLSHNNISKLASQLFEVLSIKGTGLNLSHNKIEEIEEGAFNDLVLQTGAIDLSHNALKTLKAGAFTNTKAKSMIFSHNSLESLNDAFRNSSCEAFDANHNKLTKLAFEGLKVECSLDLSHNEIASYDGAFANFESVQELNLDHNEISELSPKGFRGLENLVLLFLNNNRIKAVEEESFGDLPKLAIIYLNENQIDDLHPCCFKTNKGLTALSAIDNKLSAIDPKIFSQNVELHSLDLSQNQFADLPTNELYQGLKNLKRIQFRSNRLTVVPKNSFAEEGDEKNFEHIFLNGNQINCIEPGAFSGIKYVRYLVLSFNALGEVGEDAFGGLGAVYRLELENNSIRSLDVLKALPPTTIVLLNDNDIDRSDLSLEALELEHLQVVSFSDCSYKKDASDWKFVDSPTEEVEDPEE